ncbi:Major facilitator superfamily domain,Sugar/inositol transporter,Major facilitator [Cinara cedri]|uniref:Major facilitator superfamily domain,Sugar/inositol transporter,Major facilitator n=1 Tax=Cinara cedri TaxID=506608 RepID=A0A5E4NIV9_9HEMI|nr:Major facilitator superfamily domain,Sugar/inositol transporter,Major facilitator [Cinara cedri]
MFNEANNRLSQIVFALSASLGAFVVGTVLGWSSPAQTMLENGTAVSFEVSPMAAATVSSLFGAGAVIGAVPAGAVSAVFGRRISLIVSEAHVFFGWLMVAFPKARRMLYVGRILQGVGCGAMGTIIPMYVGEIAEPEIRGFLGGLHQLFVVAGILYSYSLGNIMTYTQFNLACGVWMALHMLGVLYIPESPYFLIREDKKVCAEEALARLRSPDHDCKSELDEIQKFVEEEQSNRFTAREVLEKDVNRKALTIGIGCMFFQQMTGINVIIFYLKHIFETSGSDFSPEVSTTIVGIIQVVMTFVSMMITDRFGRRSLLVYSMTSMGICLLGLSYYFFTKKYNPRIADSLDWLPLVAIVLYVSMYSIGCGPIPYILIGEIFSSELKSMGTGMSIATNWIFVWIVTCLASPMDTFIGPSGTFFVYSGFCFLGMLFVVNRVPETKNRSLAEIQMELENN